jgi:hypothetical protein
VTTMSKSSSSPLAVNEPATTAAVLLRALETAGFALTVTARALTVRPASRLTEDQRQAIHAHRDRLIELVRRRDPAAMQWRIDAMHRQVVSGHPLPFLVARGGIAIHADTCVSCGDPLSGPPPVMGLARCAACRQAAHIVADEVSRRCETSESHLGTGGGQAERPAEGTGETGDRERETRWTSRD